MVPFVLVDSGSWTRLESVLVNMEGSHHRLPLTSVYHHSQPITASPYTFLQALFGHEYPVGLLDEGKILPVGKEITSVGICKLRNATLEVTSCKDPPYFLFDSCRPLAVQAVSHMMKCVSVVCIMQCSNGAFNTRCTKSGKTLHCDDGCDVRPNSQYLPNGFEILW